MTRCTTCGHENPDGAKFCMECASPLALAPTATSTERKIVTALFCDIVGSTSSADGADPEDVLARFRPYYQRMRKEVERFGGTVEKFIGDAIVGVFGAPTAHEDDPERAVRAGLRILEAIEDLNAGDPSLGLQVRVGIETGGAIVTLGANTTKGEGSVIGDVMNTTARLQNVAPINGVVVGQGTYRATAHVFDFEEMGQVEVKGKAEPLMVWRVLASRSRFGTDITRNYTSPLIGRQVDLALLTGAFEKALSGPTPQLVTIVGEPGVGKTRLVAELFTHTDERVDLITWRQGRCLPYGDGITFWALGEIVKAQAGILETDGPEIAEAKIDAVVPEDHQEAPWLRQRLRPLIGLEAAPAAREENFAAWRTFLESLAEASPTVLVIEDLHWADPSLLEFLEYLADYAEGVPLLLVCTARPELFEHHAGWAGGKRNALTVNLAPLADADTAHLVSELLDAAAMPAEVRSLIVERSGGNPLYAEEFVRLLRDTATLTSRGSTWVLDPGADIPMPSGVQGLIAARLDTLEPGRKALLQDAGVVGKIFWSGALAAMGEREPEEVAAALHELSRKELVRPARQTSMQSESEFGFWHGLVRDVCYGQIPRAQRAERHRRAAEWMEARAAGRLEDLSEILANHYATALELSQVSGEEDIRSLTDKAITYLAMAGDRALEIEAAAAERHFARALGMASEEHPEYPRMLMGHGRALSRLNRFPEAAHELAAAVEGHRKREDTRGLARALCYQSTVLSYLAEPGWLDPSAEAVALLEPLGPSTELAEAHASYSECLLLANDPMGCVSQADKGLELLDSLGLPPMARLLGTRGAARLLAGDLRGATDMRRAIEDARAQGLGHDAIIMCLNLANGIFAAEGPRVMLETVLEGAAMAERLGEPGYVMTTSIYQLDPLVDSGSYDDVLRLVSELVPQLEAVGDALSLFAAEAARSTVLHRRGDTSAASSAEATLALARELARTEPKVMVYSLAAAARLSAGDEAGALALLVELEQLPGSRDDVNYPSVAPESVRTALGAANRDLAERLASGIEPLYPLHRYALASCRAMLAENDGSHAVAADLFAEVAESWGRFDMPWEEAHAWFGRARCLSALKRFDEAQAALREARNLFARLSAAPSLAEVHELMAHITAYSS